jgi:hypothetical protein
MLNVFDLHLSAPEEKAVSRICASKTRRNLQTFGWCLQTVMPVGFTILLLYEEDMQRNQRNGVSRFKEKCLRKAQHYQSSVKEEKALAN